MLLGQDIGRGLPHITRPICMVHLSLCYLEVLNLKTNGAFVSQFGAAEIRSRPHHAGNERMIGAVLRTD